MSQRATTLLWLKDSLEHLSTIQQQLEWTQDREATRLLTETMLRDLERCRHLCEAIRKKSVKVA